ncbi:Uncharacterized protein FWK35_00019781, partial [Aphis craccivora]
EPENLELAETDETQNQERNIHNFTETPPQKSIKHSTSKILNQTKLKKQIGITAIEKSIVLQNRLPKVGENSKFIHIPWTEEQKAMTKKYFQKHILLRKPPKKGEDFLVKNQYDRLSMAEN